MPDWNYSSSDPDEYTDSYTNLSSVRYYNPDAIPELTKPPDIVEADTTPYTTVTGYWP